MLITAETLLSDSALAFVAPALNPQWIAPRLEQVLGQSLVLENVRVLRHKVGRRCLIAYDLRLTDGATPVTLLGKVRSRRLDYQSYHIQQQLWHQGFDPQSPDGVSVPEPVGMIPEMHLWLQRWVPGTSATSLLPQCPALAPRIAAAICKLHHCGIPTPKHHTAATEVQILQERVPRILQHFPEWQARLAVILNACVHLANSLPQAPTASIHRDFYPDQVLISGDRIYLLDLDLYCQGDAALDIGNFVAHLSEQSLRTRSHPDAFAAQESALITAFCEHSGDINPAAIPIYKTLTLVRHIYISTQIPSRRHTTAQLLNLCEARLCQSA
ncbi:phosphotransferase [Synechococcales cyanobacterium C]|uniref:Phosphotransferase n=2 Tax=Petrachloros TaxID=2918834 RepID=A0A8K1ZYN1_9CYAN|nr:phosphotransferase [Petrachloros mirabilis ULC683]